MYDLYTAYADGALLYVYLIWCILCMFEWLIGFAFFLIRDFQLMWEQLLQPNLY